MRVYRNIIKQVEVEGVIFDVEVNVKQQIYYRCKAGALHKLDQESFAKLFPLIKSENNSSRKSLTDKSPDGTMEITK